MKRELIWILPLIALATAAPERADQEGPGEPPPPPAARGRDEFVKRFFADTDLDRNGEVSAEEFGRLARVQRLPEEKRGELFARLDKDGDGRIVPGELGGGPPRERHGPPRLHELDTNEDGGVSFDEFVLGRFVKKIPPERRRAVFDRLDTNGDGMLNREDRPKRREGPPRPEGPEGEQGGPDRERHGGPEGRRGRPPEDGGPDREGPGKRRFEGERRRDDQREKPAEPDAPAVGDTGSAE